MMPRVLVLTGAGVNCERESANALNFAGFKAEVLHIIDLLASPQKLDEVEMLFLPGGFSYGDHAGAATVFAEQMRRIEDHLLRFVQKDHLVMGVCNGCQLLLRLHLLNQSRWSFRPNALGHYECRWVDVVTSQDTAFFKKGELIALPVAHGEGQLFGGDQSEIAIQYVNGEKLATGLYPANPNGSELDVAGVCSHQGRVLAMMPHPERGFLNWQRPDAISLRERAKRQGEIFDLEKPAPAAQIFTNAYHWFK